MSLVLFLEILYSFLNLEQKNKVIFRYHEMNRTKWSGGVELSGVE